MKKLIILLLFFGLVSAQEKTAEEIWEEKVGGNKYPSSSTPAKKAQKLETQYREYLRDGFRPLNPTEEFLIVEQEWLIEQYGKEPSFSSAQHIISKYLKTEEPLWADLSFDRWYTREQTSSERITKTQGYKYRVVYTIRSTVFDKVFWIRHGAVVRDMNFKKPQKY